MSGRIDAFVDCGMILVFSGATAVKSSPGVGSHLASRVLICGISSLAVLLLCGAISEAQSQGIGVPWRWGRVRALFAWFWFDTDLGRLHPVFLGGINVGSGKRPMVLPIVSVDDVWNTGNKPPWTLPAKATYAKYDSERACKYFGVRPIKTPDFFPILSIMVFSDCSSGANTY